MTGSKSHGDILVVDDIQSNRELMEAILSNHGYRVFLADSAAQALELLEHNSVDIALVDVNMPGMDGKELCARIRADPLIAHIPVMLISAKYIERDDVVSGLNGGADEYLVKPIDSHVLLARVEAILRGKRYEDDLREANRVMAERAREIERLNQELGERNRELSDRNDRIRIELEMASEVQSTLLPQCFPRSCGLDFHVVYAPSGWVGGDYYDFVELAGGSVGILIADVAGHGMPAAFIATAAKMAFESYAASDPVPSRLVTRMNERLLPIVKGGRYITLFYAVYNPADRALLYVQAGHPRPVLVRARDNSLLELESPGRPLGIVAEGQYEDRSVVLEPGDKLILFTDGVSECVNAAYERFGASRLAKVIERSASLPVRRIVEEIYSELQRFAAAPEFSDDITLMGVQAVK
jgi:serine phosphatase RsbU (regulator of sigma subunit)